jgi:sortase A
MAKVTIVQQTKLLVGLTALLLATSACGDIVQFVPIETPGPAPVAAALEESTGIEAAITESLPSRITSEVIGLDGPVVEMGWQTVERGDEIISEWQMPINEAAWHRNSARPGEGSNIVISGHNESTGGQIFSEIEELQVGDEITLWNDNEEAFVYQVIEKNIIRTFAASAAAQNYLQTVTEPTEKEQLTLITCWPRWTNTHRLIVIAEPRQVATSSR